MCHGQYEPYKKGQTPKGGTSPVLQQWGQQHNNSSTETEVNLLNDSKILALFSAILLFQKQLIGNCLIKMGKYIFCKLDQWSTFKALSKIYK